MRLISQNGMIDVPYDKVILGICDQNNKQKYAIYSYQENPRPLFLATYSTKDKALKVMEMLRKRYLDYFEVNLGTFWYSNDHPKVFQFPEDEELEV
jgi:hypothetical protein